MLFFVMLVQYIYNKEFYKEVKLVNILKNKIALL